MIECELLKVNTKIVALSLVAMAVVGGFGVELAYAESSSANASVTVSNTISLTLAGGDLVIDNLTPGNASDSNVITASVTSNSPYGFHLSATTGTSGGTTSLVNTADSNFTFTNLDSNKATLASFSDNTWGYSYSADGTNWISGDYGAGATAGYNGLPLDGNDDGDSGVVLFNSDSYLGSKSMQFKIGAKSATTQAAGTYTNTVNFYAVTNPKPVSFDDAYAAAGKSKVNGYYAIQDATSSICTSVAQGQTGQVIDTRDNTIYHIGKLADDRCWMLDNLALDLTDASVRANLTADTTNASNSTLGYLKNGGGASPYTTTAVSSNWSDVYNAPRIKMTDKEMIPQSGTDPMASTVLAGEWKVGGYYNYCAASAGSYCYSESSSSGSALEDICPKNWRMPTGGNNGEYQTLHNNPNYDTYTNYRLALRLPLSGFFINGLTNNNNHQGSVGYWWSSSRISDGYMLSLIVNMDTIYLPNQAYSRDRGITIRCILNL